MTAEPTELGLPTMRSGVEGVPTNDQPQTGKEYTSDQEVRWCPGCGDYAVLKAVQGFLPELGLRREQAPELSHLQALYMPEEGLGPENQGRAGAGSSAARSRVADLPG